MAAGYPVEMGGPALHGRDRSVITHGPEDVTIIGVRRRGVPSIDATRSIVELKRRLKVIESVFDTRRLSHRGTDQQDIADYYSQSARSYLRFHSPEGAIHMALNPDGRFDRRGYAGQCLLVEKHLMDDRVRTVLEMGSGFGFNLRFLAARHPEVRFVGIDLVPRQVALARRHAAHLPNLTYEVGDFHRLAFKENSIDAVYAIESLCHATDLKSAFSEIRRVLMQCHVA